VIQSEAVLDIVAALLERMPPQMQLVLVSRTDPPLPLARLRVRNQLVDIRAEHLRFTVDEIAVFLNEIMKLRLSAHDIAAMEARTEGWIASLQLAALSMQASKDIHAFIAAFAGSHYYIMDYLIEEVLNAQPEKIRSFLLQTSILGRMCASLCNAVVDLNAKEGLDGQELLETLEKMNLFVTPLDDERRWYRYHHLFADVLNRRVEHLFADQLPQLHSRAAHWYEQNGFVPEAIHHALAGGDVDFAIRLIEQNGCLLLIRGELSTLPNWIKAVEPYAQARPWMYIFKAWLSALTGYPEQVEGIMRTAEDLIASQEPSVEARIMQGAIATCRAYTTNLRGETILAARFARQALDCLPDVNLLSCSLRAVAISLLGDASSWRIF
jgi:LuxR family maltose regulon positive regulatory protein